MSLWAADPVYISSYEVFPRNTFNKPTQEQKAIGGNWMIANKLIMHLSTLTITFGDAPSGGKLDNATIMANIPSSLEIEYTDRNGNKKTGEVTYLIQSSFPNATHGSNDYRVLNNGKTDLDGWDSPALQNGVLVSKIYLVTRETDINFMIDTPVTVKGPFGSFSFNALDNGKQPASEIIEYPIGGNAETDIAGGTSNVETVYGDEPLPVSPTYSIELTDKSLTLTSRQASGTDPVTSLIIKGKDLTGNANVNITFKSANSFELYNDDLNVGIPYTLGYGSSLTLEVVDNETKTASLSVSGNGSANFTELRRDNIYIELNPVGGSLTNYPGGVSYTDTITISISPDI